MLRFARLTAALALGLALAPAAMAAPLVGSFEDLVDAKANLYNTDWGHSYTVPIPDPYGSLSPGLEFIGLDTGIPARAVRTAQIGGDPIAFTPGQGFTIEVPLWSRVIDLATNETDAFGIPWDYDYRSNPDTWGFWGFDFRGLRVYSLIGMWSTSATSLVPYNPGNSPFDQLPFLVGYGFSGFVPQYQGQLFLFLANNDGYFEDNVSAYNVYITLRGLNVSEPATLALLGAGGLMIAAARRRRPASA
jgi:hypothetical protein